MEIALALTLLATRVLEAYQRRDAGTARPDDAEFIARLEDSELRVLASQQRARMIIEAREAAGEQ
jgi:hypothetical protein